MNAQNIGRSTVWRIAAVLALGACGGNSCDGCGTTPIPGGFQPLNARIANAAQFRLTNSGLDFLETVLPSMIPTLASDSLDFPIDETAVNSNITFCPGGGCMAHVSIPTAAEIGQQPVGLTPESPNRLRMLIRANVESRNAAGAQVAWPIRVSAFGFSTSCTVNVQSRAARPYLGFEGNIAFEATPEAARSGYTRMRVDSVRMVEGLEEDDFDLGGGGVCEIAGLFQSFLVDQLSSQFESALNGAFDDQLCERQGTMGCPAGTFAVGEGADAICRFANDANAACVPTLLGTDGRGDLGEAFIGSSSPGTHAPGQYVLASGGDGEAVADGLSLFFYGAFLGMSPDYQTIYPHNPCVPRLEPPPVPDVARVATFRGNGSGLGLAETPHLAFGLSEDFLNHAAYGAFDAGLLCVGFGTPTSQQLSTSVFALIAPSLSESLFPTGTSPLAILLRPQAPPSFEIGAGTAAEPVLTMSFPTLAMDFYVYTQERYVRFMTYQTDLTLQIALSVRDGEIVPTLTSLTAANSIVTNHEDFLRERPETVADTMENLLSAFASSALGELSGFSLPEVMGLQVVVPEGGIRGVEEGGDEFLGIFANLRTPVAKPAAPVDAVLTEVSPFVDPIDFVFSTLGQGELPTLDVSVASGQNVEVAVRVDNGAYSDWLPGAHVTAPAEALRLQGLHHVHVRVRETGKPETVRYFPAREVWVDGSAPQITIEGGQLLARDLLSRALEVRFSASESWEPYEEAMTLPSDVERVEVRDEAGNVASVSQSLIRGLPNGSSSGGCGGCDVTSSADTWWSVFFGLLVLSTLRRRRSLWFAAAASVAACDCGGDPQPAIDSGVPDAMADAADDATMDDGATMPSLAQGIVATHLSLAQGRDGDWYLAGYNPGAPPNRYGDLVIGHVARDLSSVNWDSIDGVPSDVAPIANPSGWRGGVSAAGDDVGQYTSMVADGDELVVSYYDATHHVLKIARGRFGSDFQAMVVDDAGDAGKYTSLVKTQTGLAVAYFAVTPPAALPGRPRTELRVATASSAAGPWVVTAVVGTDMACRPSLCGTGVCLESGECVADAAGATTLASNFVEDLPPAVGLYPSLARSGSGLALAYYDRQRGDLRGLRFDGTTWSEPFTIDGYTRNAAGVGDCGLFADLAVDGDGVWHVAYVDASEEALRYARVDGSEIVRSEVDRGEIQGSTDGRHMVGNDADLLLLPTGKIRVVYQDGTSGDARIATRQPDGTFVRRVVDAEDSTGYFTVQGADGDASVIAMWYRGQAGQSRNGVRIFRADD